MGESGGWEDKNLEKETILSETIVLVRTDLRQSPN